MASETTFFGVFFPLSKLERHISLASIYTGSEVRTIGYNLPASIERAKNGHMSIPGHFECSDWLLYQRAGCQAIMSDTW